MEMSSENLLEELRRKDRVIEEQKENIEELKKEVEKYKKIVEDLRDEIDDRGDSQNEAQNSSSKTPQSRYWTAEEHTRFLEAIRKYGDKDVKSIAAYVGSRNATQVRTHGQKYYLRLEREKRKKDEEEKVVPEVSDAVSAEKPKSFQKKKTPSSKRRKSFGDHPQSLSRELPRNTQPPAIPHFIQQQIAAETKDSVLATLKGWTSSEYNAFIEGLVSYSDEKDINVRCKLIADNYLPGFTADEIKHCFTVLSNVAKAKERDEDFTAEERRTNIFHYQNPLKETEASPIEVPFQQTTHMKSSQLIHRVALSHQKEGQASQWTPPL